MEDIKIAVQIATAALEDKKAQDIKVLDIRDLTIIADYFIIASGQNANQLQAMADNVEDALFAEGIKLSHSEGYQKASWILLDFNSIIIHLFNKEDRSFYNLERIWGDATEIRMEKIK